MKKIVIAIFFISLVLLMFVEHKHETVYRVEENMLVFESGNYALLSTEVGRKTYENPLGLRRYTKFTYDHKLIEEGIVDKDGTLLPDNDPAETGTLFFFTLMALSLTAYLLLFASADIIALRDWRTSKTDIALTAMLPDKRNQSLANKMACVKCNPAPDFDITKEERVQGMIFIEGKCNLCQEQRRLRVK